MFQLLDNNIAQVIINMAVIKSHQKEKSGRKNLLAFRYQRDLEALGLGNGDPYRAWWLGSW